MDRREWLRIVILSVSAGTLGATFIPKWLEGGIGRMSVMNAQTAYRNMPGQEHPEWQGLSDEELRTAIENYKPEPVSLDSFVNEHYSLVKAGVPVSAKVENGRVVNAQTGHVYLPAAHLKEKLAKGGSLSKIAMDTYGVGMRYFARDNLSNIIEFPGGGAFNVFPEADQKIAIQTNDLAPFLGDITWTTSSTQYNLSHYQDGFLGSHNTPPGVSQGTEALFPQFRNPHSNNWIQNDSHAADPDYETFAMVSHVDTDNPLPVELSSFIARAGNKKVDLEWVTQSELENLGFNMYRREKNGGQNFQNINHSLELFKDNAPISLNGGLIPGEGNKSARTDYKAIDKLVENGKTYEYMLSDVDYNGWETFHDIVEATPSKLAAAPDSFKLYHNYPNPFNPGTTIKFDVQEKSRVSLEIYNTLGQQVAKLIDNEVFEPGREYTAQLNAKDLSLTSGAYIARLTGGRQSQAIRMIYLK